MSINPNFYKLFIDTSQKTYGSNTSSSFFLEDNIINEYSSFNVQLNKCAIVHSQYPTNSNNNTLVFYENNNDVASATITIPEGTYTGATYASTLATLLTTESLATLNGYTYTVTYDSVTFKITISAGANVFRIDSASTCELQLGLSTYEVSHVTTQTMASTVQLAGTKYVDVTISFNTDNIGGIYNYNVLERIHIIAGFGGYIFFENNSHQVVHRVRSNELNNIKIELRDDLGNVFEEQVNAYNSYTLLLTPHIS
jgi:hypothetical protein